MADERIRRRILDWLDRKPEDCWLEIGAGHGEMTLLLAQAGAGVVAVERDRKLAADLPKHLQAFPCARVVEADILKVSLPALAQESGCRRFRVYGNLPYYITSPILRRLFDSLAVIADIHIVVQREVAERLTAPPGGREYGYLSVLAQFYTTPEILQPIPRGAFRPPPRVESALVRLTPPGQQPALGVEDAADFLRFVSAGFRHKRKTLANNLRGLYGHARVQAALTQSGIDPRVRAEELSLQQFAQLYRILEKRGAPPR